MDDRTRPVELREAALDSAAGGIADGTSNTIIFGETGGGTTDATDGSSNTIIVGETAPPRIKYPNLVLKKG